MLKKPEFYITVSPNPSNPGDYINLVGISEQGIGYANIDITDGSGKVLHSFTSPVGSTGYLSYSFHGDMGPGQYTVTVSNPSLKAPYTTVMSIVAPGGSVPVTTVITPAQAGTVPAAVTTEETTPAPVPSPTKSPVAPATVLTALIIGVISLGIIRR
jgi:hypothetical protein